MTPEHPAWSAPSQFRHRVLRIRQISMKLLFLECQEKVSCPKKKRCFCCTKKSNTLFLVQILVWWILLVGDENHSHFFEDAEKPFCQDAKAPLEFYPPFFLRRSRFDPHFCWNIPIPFAKSQYHTINTIWANEIIFHQPRVPWNSRDFPSLAELPKLGAQVGWGRELIWPVEWYPPKMSESNAQNTPPNCLHQGFQKSGFANTIRGLLGCLWKRS